LIENFLNIYFNFSDIIYIIRICEFECGCIDKVPEDVAAVSDSVMMFARHAGNHSTLIAITVNSNKGWRMFTESKENN